MTMPASANGVRPFLTQHAVDRIAGDEIPGRYCATRRMWVVEIDGQAHALIDIAGGLAELVTKTKVEVETDDTEISTLGLLTKTDVSTERDDDNRLGSALLSLLTKTEVKTEQDKADMGGLEAALLEGHTKTLVRVEEDRQDMGGWGAAILETSTKTAVTTEQDDNARGLDLGPLQH